jgi:hypothetical protein
MPLKPGAEVAAASDTSMTTRAVTDERAVKTTLERYRTAYNGLNPFEAKAVWPSVDVGALSRAFDQLVSQAIEFTACDVQVAGDRAHAVCGGHASFVPKVGSHEPRRTAREWRFQLHRAAEGWVIARMDTR